MKKQNGMNKLTFNKVAVIELNDSVLNRINGGDGLGDAADAVSNVITKLMDQANNAGYALSYAITTRIR